ncbi:hypothetical protein CK203_028037 [Vitis vinifera]|uniref:Uncharacterized protein n=1 Tax=Vitis vinifera TaxID=29760 RepID=A0A438ILX8_VITVI|nr:hypothetical protein CK203_028037 [Vitis vinifera]
MSLEDVIIHVRIEEQNRNRDNVEKTKELSSKANSKYHATQCHHKKRTEKFNSKANLVVREVISAVVSFEACMVTNMKDWVVVDSGATRHICGNQCFQNRTGY